MWIICQKDVSLLKSRCNSSISPATSWSVSNVLCSWFYMINLYIRRREFDASEVMKDDSHKCWLRLYGHLKFWQFGNKLEEAEGGSGPLNHAQRKIKLKNIWPSLIIKVFSGCVCVISGTRWRGILENDALVESRQLCKRTAQRQKISLSTDLSIDPQQGQVC